MRSGHAYALSLSTKVSAPKTRTDRQLIEAIQVVSRDFDKVLVVTHLPQLKAAFPVQVEVTKHPDLGSRFEIVRHN